MVGPRQARSIAEFLGWRWASAVTPDAMWMTSRTIVWGPLELVRRVRRAHPRSVIVWRIDGLVVPFTRDDCELVASLEHIVAPNQGVHRRLEAALGGEHRRVSVIQPHVPFEPPERPSAPPSNDHCIGVVTRTKDAPSLLLTLHRLMKSGLLACPDCARTVPAPFDPPTHRYLPVDRCLCGSTYRAKPPLSMSVRLAVTDEGDVAPEAVVRWLELDDGIEVVRLGADPWQDLAAWFASSRVVVCASSAVDLPCAAEVPLAMGVHTIVPQHVAHRESASMRRVATRTETDAFGRVCHVLDPLALDYALRVVLEVEPPVSPPITAAHATDAMILWRRLVAELPLPDDSLVRLPLGHRRIVAR